MHDSTIYYRTQKGSDEIEHRTLKLGNELRFVLILVDGKSSVAKTASKAPPWWDVKHKLQELEEQGFISMSPIPAELLDVPAVGTGETQNDTTEELDTKSLLIRTAKAILGEQSSKVVARLEESADSHDALLTTVDGCVKLVQLVIDVEKGNTLKRECYQILGTDI